MTKQQSINLAGRDIIHAKMQQKETVTITKVSIIDRLANHGKAVELLTKEEKLSCGPVYDVHVLVKQLGHNAMVVSTDTVSKAEWLRKVSNEFADVKDRLVYVNTGSGISTVLAKDYYDDILRIDFGASYSAEEALISKVSKLGVILRAKFNGDVRYRYFFKHENGIWLDLAMYLDNPDPQVNGRWNITHNRAMSNELIKAFIDNGTITEHNIYVFFNSSPSSTRGFSGDFIKVPDENADVHQYLKKMYSLATNGLTDEMQLDWADGEEYQKAIKDMSRTTLAMTDAREYRDVARGFCMVNTKFVVKDAADKTGQALIEAFDGAYLASVNLYARMFEQAFGHAPTDKQLREFHGDCAQMRIACQLKGMAQFFNETCLTMALNNIMSGNLTNGEPCRVLLFHGYKDVQAKKHLIKKGDMIFSGPAYNGIKADYAGYIVKKEEKIAELFKRTDVVGDMNAYKYMRVITEEQSVNLMAFPPALEKDSTVSLSNQTLNSLLWNIQLENGEYKHCGGKDIVIELFKKNIAQLFEQDLDTKLRLAHFTNFDSYADSAIKAINNGAYLLDHYSRYTAMSQLTEKINNMINGFNFEVEGFNAIGIIDPGLWLTGKPTIGAFETVSGNVDEVTKKKVAVYRHPRINRFSLLILNDLNVAYLLNRTHKDTVCGVFSFEQFKAIESVYNGIYGRVAVVPSFNSLFPLTHDGSDYDGDTYLFVLSAILIDLISKMSPVAIEYGKAPKVDEKVVFDIVNIGKGSMGPRRAFYEYYNTGNLDIGQMARFNSTIIGLLDQLENGLMTQSEYSALVSVLNFEADGKEKQVFFAEKPAYTNFFIPKNNSVVADADAINKWIDYCATRSIVNGKSLHALLTDITIANSSVMGRIIDAAKTGEKVYAPFIDLFKNVKCAYGKNHVGITDIKVDYAAQSVVSGKIVVEDKFSVSNYVERGIVAVSKDRNIYIVNDLSRQIKNRCADIFVEEANKYLAKLNEQYTALKDTLTAQILSSDWSLAKGYEGAKGIGRIYSGIINNRKDASQEVVPYIANSFRLYAGNDCAYKDRLKLALAACYSEAKEKKDGQLSIDRTRGYKALGAELGILAVCDKVSDATELNAEDRVYTTGNQEIKHDTVLNFVKGLAKLDDGYAICEKADGRYKVVHDEEGRTYATIDVAEFLKAKAAVNSKFIINFLPAKATKNCDQAMKNELLKDAVNSLVTIYNDEAIKQRYALISKMIKCGKYFYAFLIAVDTMDTARFKVVARIHTENSEGFSWNNEAKCFNEAQWNILNNRQWNIDNVLTYTNNSDKAFGTACLSNKRVENNAIFAIPADQIMSQYNQL